MAGAAAYAASEINFEVVVRMKDGVDNRYGRILTIGGTSWASWVIVEVAAAEVVADIVVVRLSAPDVSTFGQLSP